MASHCDKSYSASIFFFFFCLFKQPPIFIYFCTNNACFLTKPPWRFRKEQKNFMQETLMWASERKVQARHFLKLLPAQHNANYVPSGKWRMKSFAPFLAQREMIQLVKKKEGEGMKQQRLNNTNSHDTVNAETASVLCWALFSPQWRFNFFPFPRIGCYPKKAM